MKYKRNIGRIDQVLRIGISLGLLYISLINQDIITDSFSASAIAAIAVGNLVVALIRYCPLYGVTGISTCNLD